MRPQKRFGICALVLASALTAAAQGPPPGGQAPPRDGQAALTGTATINYHSWGLKTYRKLGVLKVDPEVKIRFKFTGEVEAGK